MPIAEVGVFSLTDAATQAFNLIAPAWNALTSNPLGVVCIGVFVAGLGFGLVRKLKGTAKH